MVRHWPSPTPRERGRRVHDVGKERRDDAAAHESGRGERARAAELERGGAPRPRPTHASWPGGIRGIADEVDARAVAISTWSRPLSTTTMWWCWHRPCPRSARGPSTSATPAGGGTPEHHVVERGDRSSPWGNVRTSFDSANGRRWSRGMQLPVSALSGPASGVSRERDRVSGWRARRTSRQSNGVGNGRGENGRHGTRRYSVARSGSRGCVLEDQPEQA
jgi:hypothetical protein